MDTDVVLFHPAYAPQLGSQLRITHAQLNIIGGAGNGKITLFILLCHANSLQSVAVSAVLLSEESLTPEVPESCLCAPFFSFLEDTREYDISMTREFQRTLRLFPCSASPS